MDAIFGRFHQAGGSNKRQADSTGLGLSIAKAIVERRGGKLTVASELGRGSVFGIALPMANPQKQKAA